MLVCHCGVCIYLQGPQDHIWGWTDSVLQQSPKTQRIYYQLLFGSGNHYILNHQAWSHGKGRQEHRAAGMHCWRGSQWTTSISSRLMWEEPTNNRVLKWRWTPSSCSIKTVCQSDLCPRTCCYIRWVPEGPIKSRACEAEQVQQFIYQDVKVLGIWCRRKPGVFKVWEQRPHLPRLPLNQED